MHKYEQICACTSIMRMNTSFDWFDVFYLLASPELAVPAPGFLFVPRC